MNLIYINGVVSVFLINHLKVVTKPIGIICLEMANTAAYTVLLS